MMKYKTTDSGTWVKKALTLLVGGVFLILGIIGLLIPVLPGLPFLLLAAFCFAETSAGVRAKLSHWYHYHRTKQLNPGKTGLSRAEKIELTAWRAAARVMEILRWKKAPRSE